MRLRVAIKPARLALSLGLQDSGKSGSVTVKSMQARSAAGRAIVAEVETGVAPAKSYERTIKIRKATIETRIGVRFGLHPETKQVIITELYSGYPAHDCGNLFVGDVVTKINKVLVTDVDMASQLVKMTEGEVELKTENVYMSPHKAGTPGNPARTFTPASASAQRGAAPPPPPPEVDLLGGFAEQSTAISTR